MPAFTIACKKCGWWTPVVNWRGRASFLWREHVADGTHMNRIKEQSND